MEQISMAVFCIQNAVNLYWGLCPLDPNGVLHEALCTHRCSIINPSISDKKIPAPGATLDEKKARTKQKTNKPRKQKTPKLKLFMSKQNANTFFVSLLSRSEVFVTNFLVCYSNWTKFNYIKCHWTIINCQPLHKMQITHDYSSTVIYFDKYLYQPLSAKHLLTYNLPHLCLVLK